MRAYVMRLTLVSFCFVVAFAGDEVWNTIGGTQCNTKSVANCASTDECTVQSGACGCKYEHVLLNICYGGFASYIWYASSPSTAAIVGGYVVPHASMVTRSPKSSCFLDKHDHHGGSNGTYKMYSCTGKNDGDQPDDVRYMDSNCQNVDGANSTVQKHLRCVSDGTRPSSVGKNGVTSLCMRDGCTSTICNANEQTCVSGHFKDSSIYPCKYDGGSCSCDTTISQFRKMVCYEGAASYLYFNTASDCSANQNVVDSVTMSINAKCNSDAYSWSVGGNVESGSFKRLTCSGVANYNTIQWHHYTDTKCPAVGTNPALSRPATDTRYTEDCTCVPKYVAPTAQPISGAPGYLKYSYYSSDACGGAAIASQNDKADGACFRVHKFNATIGLVENENTWMKLKMSCESTGSQSGMYRYSRQTFSDSACTAANEHGVLSYGELEMKCDSKSSDGTTYGQKIELICAGQAAHLEIVESEAFALSKASMNSMRITFFYILALLIR